VEIGRGSQTAQKFIRLRRIPGRKPSTHADLDCFANGQKRRFTKSGRFVYFVFAAALGRSTDRLTSHIFDVAVAVFVFIDGLVQSFHRKLNAVVFFGGKIDKLGEHMAVIKGSGLVETFSFDDIDRRHGSGDRPRTAKDLVFDIGNFILVDF
jgi:hypothetical protein